MSFLEREVSKWCLRSVTKDMGDHPKPTAPVMGVGIDNLSSIHNKVLGINVWIGSFSNSLSFGISS